MNKLLKEAIADAKAVRETALANAKLALEEAFTPRLQSMLSARLSEEEEMEMEEDEEMAMDTPVEEVPTEEPAMEEGDYSDEEVSEEEEMDMEEDMEAPAEPEMEEYMEGEGEDDLELEAIIRELEDEIEEQSDSTDIGNGDNKMDAATASDEEDPGKGKMTEDESTPEEDPALEEGEETEDDVSIDEIIKALREEDEEEVTEGEESEEAEVTEAAEEDLEEAYTVIKFLKSKINEVNLLNAKLLFSNKLFRNFAMNESQKMKVIENFDRASTIREVKLVFSTLAESLKVNKTKRIVKESTASRPTRSTAPKRILSEGNQLASRWAKLAGLNKNN
jgi:hypothetical protein|tara:strand:+ start:1536 stop:2540 length:1005 start_codon:yes stop_codon:yes gene_type:complete